MTLEQFWQLVEASKRECDDDCEAQAEILRNKLANLPENEIVAFDEIWWQQRQRAYKRELWGAAFLMNGGCSDDGFEYFRAWLISRGLDVFERALANPDSLAEQVHPDVESYELEDMLNPAYDAYLEKTGEEIPSPERKWAELTGAEWEEDELDDLYPSIAARLNAA